MIISTTNSTDVVFRHEEPATAIAIDDDNKAICVIVFNCVRIQGSIEDMCQLKELASQALAKGLTHEREGDDF